MRVALLCLVLAGCSAGATGGPSEPARQPIAHQLDTQGVQLLDRPQRIDFGRTDHSAESAMSKLLAAEPVARGACAGGGAFVEWRDGTRLISRQGTFRGWSRGQEAEGLACA